METLEALIPMISEQNWETTRPLQDIAQRLEVAENCCFHQTRTEVGVTVVDYNSKQQQEGEVGRQFQTNLV